MKQKANSNIYNKSNKLSIRKNIILTKNPN